MRPSRSDYPTPSNKLLLTNNLKYTLILIGVIGRLLPHPPNFTPIGGLAIWGGSRLNGLGRYSIVLITMIVCDIFLGFHATMPYVYGSIVLGTWIASRVKKTTTFNIATVTVLNGLLFFAITNFGVWQSSNLYQKTLTGLVDSYISALPFLRLSLFGDIVYTLGFFGLEHITKLLIEAKHKTALIRTGG